MTNREDVLKCYLHLSNINVIGRIRHDILISNFGDIPSALSASHKSLCACRGISSTTADKILSPMNHQLLEKDILPVSFHCHIYS